MAARGARAHLWWILVAIALLLLLAVHLVQTVEPVRVVFIHLGAMVSTRAVFGNLRLTGTRQLAVQSVHCRKR